MTTAEIAIWGTGGHGRECLQLAIDCLESPRRDHWNPSNFGILGFLDDNAERWGTVMNGYPVLGGLDWALANQQVGIVVGVGLPRVKEVIGTRLLGAGLSLTTLVHPSAVVGREVVIGAGSVICAQTIVSTNIELGDLVTVNMGAGVAHDCVVGRYSTVSPGARLSGNVALEEGCDIGTGAVVIQGKRIGAWTVVGAGAAVIDDLPANCTAVGVPAKPIQR